MKNEPFGVIIIKLFLVLAATLVVIAWFKTFMC